MPPTITRVSQPSLTELKRRGWVPTGAIDESSPRDRATSGIALTSGTMFLMGNLLVPAGTTVTSLTFRVSTSPTTPTNTWFALVRLSDLSVLGKTNDLGGAAVGTGFRTLNLSAPWTPLVNTAVYAGIVSVAATALSVNGVAVSALMTAAAPVLCGASTTGLTDPASLGATAASVTAGASIVYAYLS